MSCDCEEPQQPTEPVSPLAVQIDPQPTVWESVKAVALARIERTLKDTIVILTMTFHLSLLGAAFKGMPMIAALTFASWLTICLGCITVAVGFIGEDDDFED